MLDGPDRKEGRAQYPRKRPHSVRSVHFIRGSIENRQFSEGLLDLMSNATAKRVIRTLLVHSELGKKHGDDIVLPNIGQEVLADMTGTTKSRINYFIHK